MSEPKVKLTPEAKALFKQQLSIAGAGLAMFARQFREHGYNQSEATSLAASVALNAAWQGAAAARLDEGGEPSPDRFISLARKVTSASITWNPTGLQTWRLLMSTEDTNQEPAP